MMTAGTNSSTAVACQSLLDRSYLEVSYRFRDEMDHPARLLAERLVVHFCLPTMREEKRIWEQPYRFADHHGASALRALARREKNGRMASRMVAIDNALDGMTRTAAARLARMDRQTSHDWVVCYNADGIDGLYDQPKGHNPEKLSESEQAVLLAKVFQNPDPVKASGSTSDNGS